MSTRVLAVAALLGSLPALSWAQTPALTEFQVNTYTTGLQSNPSVASDSAGNFVVVWRSYAQDGSLEGIFGRRFDAAGAPGVEFPVNTFTTSAQNWPRVASDPGGDFVVVWETFLVDGSGYSVEAQRYDASGAALGANFRVNDFTTGDQTRPDISMDASGNFVVVWHSFDQDGSLFGIRGQRFDAAGAFKGAEFAVNTYTSGDQLYPAVASAPGGGFVVVWQSPLQDGSDFGIVGRRYDAAGVPLGGEFQVNSYTTGVQHRPDLAVAPGGGFMVTWEDQGQDGSYSGVFARRYDASGVAQGGEFRVNSFTTLLQERPAIAADGTGHFVVVWSDQQEGILIDVSAQIGLSGRRFSPSGTPVGAEFRVNAYTTGNQQTAAVAADATGGFVVTWSSSGGQDGSGYGVFGQRFELSDLIFADGFE